MMNIVNKLGIKFMHDHLIVNKSQQHSKKETPTNSLLIEFVTEELPPINIMQNIGWSFYNSLVKELNSFIITNTTPEIFVTPRRFGCIIHNVSIIEKSQPLIRRGPSIDSAFINNQPTSALLGFAKSCKLQNWQDLKQKDGYFYHTQTKNDQTLSLVLPDAITNSLKVQDLNFLAMQHLVHFS